MISFVKRTGLKVLVPFWRFFHRHHITILMLHGVMDKVSAKSTWMPMRHQLPPKRLDFALRVLSSRYRFISLADAVDMLKGLKPVESHCMVLTFDDGYRNNLTHALPILRKYNAPATIFLSTGHITRREPFWYDRLDYAMQSLWNKHEVQLDSKIIRFTPGDRLALDSAFRELRYGLKDISENYIDTMRKIEQIVTNFESLSQSRLSDIFEDDPWTALMTWDEVRSATLEGVTFGSHTVDHALLGKLDQVNAVEQLSISRDDIEKQTGKPCRFLCYPSGNYSSQVINLAEKCAYIAAVTTKNGLNLQGHAPLLALHRYSFPDSDQVISIIAGASGLTSCIKRKGL